MKKFSILALFIFLFAASANAGERLVPADDNIPGNGYYSHPKALEMWDKFEKDTDYAFGYASRETDILYGRITGGECRDNKSWFAVAIGKYPQDPAKALLHVDAVCNGKRILGNLDYALNAKAERQYLVAKGDGADMNTYLLGMLKVGNENLEMGGSIECKWKYDIARPDLETTGRVEIFGRRDLNSINLGSFKGHTMSWDHDHQAKYEPRPDWAN